jgi:23S rRNA (adenine2503-C2)-methyltransferase
MLRDVNDTVADAAELVRLVSDIECKVNLIVFNVHEGSEYQPSLDEDVERFRCCSLLAMFTLHIIPEPFGHS